MAINLILLKRVIISAIFCYSGVLMAVEEPKYVVKSKSENFEIRLYQGTLVAETLIEGQFDEVGTKGFKILADYIFGNNKAKTKIDMTAPVAQQESGVKIEMTAPVSQISDSGGHLIQFTMPENFTLDTLPVPNDSRIRLRAIEPRLVAVYSYSGSWSEARYKEKLKEFNSELAKSNIKTVGNPIFARFNSPFQLWFLRRNEIWMEVAP